MMTAIQQGWERGRSIVDVPPPGPGGDNGETTPAAYESAGDASGAPVIGEVPVADTETSRTQTDDTSSDDGGSGG